MDLDGRFADAELPRDLLVRVTAEEAAQDLAFATRDAARSRGVGDRRGVAGVRRTEAPVPDEHQRRLRRKYLLTEHDELERAARQTSPADDPTRTTRDRAVAAALDSRARERL